MTTPDAPRQNTFHFLLILLCLRFGTKDFPFCHLLLYDVHRLPDLHRSIVNLEAHKSCVVSTSVRAIALVDRRQVGKITDMKIDQKQSFSLEGEQMTERWRVKEREREYRQTRGGEEKTDRVKWQMGGE